MSYPPYGGGGYPPQPGYPAPGGYGAGPGYPQQPGGYPPPGGVSAAMTKSFFTMICTFSGHQNLFLAKLT